MTSSKSTKRALISSTLAILMCVAMLIGTTFAWFTDTASTAVNKIQAGNLDIEVEYAKEAMDSEGNLTGEITEFKTIKDSTEVFDNNALWEPGRREYVIFRISNKGSLALKYKFNLAVVNQKAGVNKAGEEYFLADYLCASAKASEEKNFDYSSGFSSAGMYFTLWNDLSAAGTTPALAEKPLSSAAFEGTLKAGEKQAAAMVVWMPTTVGNKANAISPDKAATVDFGINVVATQDTVEKDSFDNQYDAKADVELATSATINGQAYASTQEAYEAVQPQVSTVFGLGQEAFSDGDTDKCAKFDELFPDGKITWTIYGEQKLTDPYMLSFGRKASYFGARTLKEIEVVGGNSQATLDLTGTNGTFALPYNWWGSTVDNIKITFKGITFKGIESIPGTWATPEQETPYTFENCTFNGKVYGYHDYNINLTIKNCTFNAPENTQYALMLQSTTGITGKVTVEGCTFNGYTRGINLQRPNTDFVVTNNTIRSTVSEPDRGAIQLTDGKSFVVTGNTVDVNAGNAFWFHNAATNGNVTYTISNNNIKAPYIGYSGVTSFDVNTKITSSGNKFNNTDTTKCMKKEATVAEATNLTAIH